MPLNRTECRIQAVPGPTDNTRRNSLERLYGRILSPFESFFQRTGSGGIVLIGAAVLTLVLANSPWGLPYRSFWEQVFSVSFGSRTIALSLHDWINDGLMAVFFLLVGLELKREILVGELSSPMNASLPVIAALGGMIVPGIIYHVINRNTPGAAGWGIPMATDIAFSLGILVLISSRVPRNSIIFLMALAIADDLGAVIIIALFYMKAMNPAAIGFAAAVAATLFVCNRAGVRHPLPYWGLGVLLWLAMLHSGIHATIAGIILAIAIPTRPLCSAPGFERRLFRLHREFAREAEPHNPPNHVLSNLRMGEIAMDVEKNARAAQSPLHRMEQSLNPWVSFLVLPLFALCNVAISFRDIAAAGGPVDRVSVGVFLGLLLGKFIGISLFSWAAVRLGLSRLPAGVGWNYLLGVAWLGGIGFTMAIFISELALPDPALRDIAKMEILAASVIAGILGTAWLVWNGSGKNRATAEE